VRSREPGCARPASCIARLSAIGCALFAFALSSTPACGTATNEQAEELAELGPDDASFDGALSFDGVDDYASVGTARSPQIQREQSLMLWFRPEVAESGAASDLQVLFTLRRSGWSGIALGLDHGVPVAYNVFGPRDLARSDSALAPGDWHHLALVIDPEGSTLYLDGAVAGTGPEPATNRTPTQAFIGSLDGYSDMFHGVLDELRVYDRTFTAAEVAAVAAGSRPDDAEPLVIYLPFNEAGGARSYDRSGLGNHAELGDGVAELMPTRVVSGVP
jgi:Concanavalin A-like lectin/glucanases superfamily